MQKKCFRERETSSGRRLPKSLHRWATPSLALLVAVTLLATVPARAQLPDSQGTAVETATVGNVEIPSLGFDAPFAVTPGMVTTVGLPRFSESRTSDFIEPRGVHVTAADVTVYGLNQREFSTDAFLGLPTDILGT